MKRAMRLSLLLALLSAPLLAAGCGDDSADDHAKSEADAGDQPAAPRQGKLARPALPKPPKGGLPADLRPPR
jgi:hypothetical protein